MFSLLRVKPKRIDLQGKGEQREGSRSRQETEIYRRISIARPAERDARVGGRSDDVNDDTLERKRQAKEGRKK
jgi:hypothetical protein